MYTLVFHQEQARSSVVYSEVSVLASTIIVHSGPSSLHRHVRHYDSGAPFLHRHVRSCTSETSLFRRHVHSCTRRRCFLRRHVRSCTQSRWYPQARELFTRAVVSPQARFQRRASVIPGSKTHLCFLGTSLWVGTASLAHFGFVRFLFPSALGEVLFA